LGETFYIGFLYRDVADESDFLRTARSVWLEIRRPEQFGHPLGADPELVISEVVGIRIPPYASVTFTYRF
jgi:hypothetical protein